AHRRDDAVDDRLRAPRRLLDREARDAARERGRGDEGEGENETATHEVLVDARRPVSPARGKRIISKGAIRTRAALFLSRENGFTCHWTLVTWHLSFACRGQSTTMTSAQ